MHSTKDKGMIFTHFITTFAGVIKISQKHCGLWGPEQTLGKHVLKQNRRAPLNQSCFLMFSGGGPCGLDMENSVWKRLGGNTDTKKHTRLPRVSLSLSLSFKGNTCTIVIFCCCSPGTHSCDGPHPLSSQKVASRYLERKWFLPFVPSRDPLKGAVSVHFRKYLKWDRYDSFTWPPRRSS